MREDFIKNLRNENRKKRKERFEHPASHDVNEYVANIDHTIEHVMKHILLRLIYKVIRGYKIDGDKLERWTTNYVNNPKLCPGTSSKRGDRRNNMKQAMRHTEAITWRWFLIILQALDVREFEITFKVRHRSGREYEVSDNVPLATYRFWSSMKLNNLDGITNQISSTTGAIENKVNDVQNRVQSTIGNAERGIESAQNLYNNVTAKAGETFDKISNIGNTISEKFGNVFGVATKSR